MLNINDIFDVVLNNINDVALNNINDVALNNNNNQILSRHDLTCSDKHFCPDMLQDFGFYRG